MEAIDGGTTMVVDHAHINYSADHCERPPLLGTVSHRITSCICIVSNRRIWNSLVFLLLSGTSETGCFVGSLSI